MTYTARQGDTDTSVILSSQDEKESTRDVRARTRGFQLKKQKDRAHSTGGIEARKRSREDEGCLVCLETMEDWMLIECENCEGQMCSECSRIDAALIKAVF